MRKTSDPIKIRTAIDFGEMVLLPFEGKDWKVLGIVSVDETSQNWAVMIEYPDDPMLHRLLSLAELGEEFCIYEQEDIAVDTLLGDISIDL